MIGQTNEVIQHLRGAVLRREGAGLTDGQLLENYIHCGDEAAFAALVRRHGPMVWGVCRRVLRNHHDAEDAFQATFLVLVRKAASIASRELLANWLHGVAYQTARKARATTAKRKERERQVSEMPEPEVVQQQIWDTLQPLLDQELSRLPDKYRIPILLCDLQGKTRKQAAQELRCPEGTVAGRLARARAMLAKRLARHGVVLSGAALAVALSRTAAIAGVPPSVMSSTIKAASLFAAQAAAEGVISARVAALTEGVLKTMLLAKLKVGTMVLLVVAVLGIGASLLPWWTVEAGQAERKPLPTPQARPEIQQSKANGKGEPKPRIIKAGGFVFRMAWGAGDKTLATVSLSQEKVEREIGGQKRQVTQFNSTVKFWDAEKGELQMTLGEEKKVRVESVSFSPDGKLAALAALTGVTGRGDAYEIRLVDPRTGDFKKTFKQPDPARTVAFSPNGKTLAIGGAVLPLNLSGPFHRVVQVWDMHRGKVTTEFKQKLDLQEGEPYLDGLHDLTFSPDGKLLAAADADSKVRLLDAGTGKLLHTLEGHTSVSLSVKFAPDSKTVVSGSLDQTVKVWDVQTGKNLRTLQEHPGRVNSVAYSPDGKLLATAGEGLILWDTSSWQATKVPTKEGDPVSAVTFSPGDGKTLAVATGGQVNLWRLNELLPGSK